MNLTKTVATVGVGAAIIAGSMLAVSTVSAHSGTRSDSVAAEVASRFNLNEAEVQSFFDEKRTEKRENREEERAEHLASLVSEGKLSQSQADALKAKQDELQAARDAVRNQDLTREERKAAMTEIKEGFEAWANEQSINLDNLHPEGRGEQGHSKRHGNS